MCRRARVLAFRFWLPRVAGAHVFPGALAHTWRVGVDSVLWLRRVCARTAASRLAALCSQVFASVCGAQSPECARALMQEAIRGVVLQRGGLTFFREGSARGNARMVAFARAMYSQLFAEARQ